MCRLGHTAARRCFLFRLGLGALLDHGLKVNTATVLLYVEHSVINDLLPPSGENKTVAVLRDAAPRVLSQSSNPSVTHSKQEVQGPLRGVKQKFVYILQSQIETEKNLFLFQMTHFVFLFVLLCFPTATSCRVNVA